MFATCNDLLIQFIPQYKRTGRWEAHIWDSSVSGSSSKGKQLHLGSFLTSQQAARAYDRAALLMRGNDAELNFPMVDYTTDGVLEALRALPKSQMIMALRKTIDTEVRHG